MKGGKGEGLLINSIIQVRRVTTSWYILSSPLYKEKEMRYAPWEQKVCLQGPAHIHTHARTHAHLGARAHTHTYRARTKTETPYFITLCL